MLIGARAESSSSPSTTTSSLTWITWFCSLPGHEYFCEVAEVRAAPASVEIDVSRTLSRTTLISRGSARSCRSTRRRWRWCSTSRQVRDLVQRIRLTPRQKRNRTRSPTCPSSSRARSSCTASSTSASSSRVRACSRWCVAAIEIRLTRQFAKLDASHFGVCPRVYCTSGKLVPCGRSDLPGVDTVKLYCPSCVDMYVPPSSRFSGVDGTSLSLAPPSLTTTGAFFGTTFPHLLFQTYPSAMPFPPSTTPVVVPPGPKVVSTPLTSVAKVYIPRIYGFRVSERARSGPRMQWLRMRPAEGELEWTEQGMVAGPEETGEREQGALYEGKDDDDEDDEEGEEEEEEEDPTEMQMSGVVGTPPTAKGAILDGERGRTTVEASSLMNERVYRPLPAPRSSPSTNLASVPITTNPSNTVLPRKASINSLGATVRAQAVAPPSSSVAGNALGSAMGSVAGVKGGLRVVKSKPKGLEHESVGEVA